jgi:hypothetical protein
MRIGSDAMANVRMLRALLERLENRKNSGFHHFHMPDGHTRVLTNEQCFRGFHNACQGNFNGDEARTVFRAVSSDFGPQMLELLHVVIESKNQKEEEI